MHAQDPHGRKLQDIILTPKETKPGHARGWKFLSSLTKILSILFFDRTWVGPIQIVLKKRNIIVVKNDNNELIPTITFTGWKVCIDYRN